MIPYFCNEENWKKFSDEAVTWLKTPYRHYQRVKGYGADCTMFFGQVFCDVGILKELTYEYYSMDWHINTEEPVVENSILVNFNKNMNIPGLSFKKLLRNDNDIIRGDFLLFGTVKSSLSNHVGVMWDDGGKILHCINRRGVEFTFYNNWWKRHTRYKIRLFKEF